VRDLRNRQVLRFPDEGTFELTYPAAKQVAEKAQGVRSRVTDQFVEGEVEWFIKNSYNIGLQYYGEWPRERSIRMLEAFLEVRISPFTFCSY